MIYLDNGATSYPKPTQVHTAMAQALCVYGANPGRSGYTMSMNTGAAMYDCRQSAATFFHADGPECVIFQPSCTQGINTVLKGVLVEGDHVVISDMEHNAVMRPLRKLEKKGIRFQIAKTYPGNDALTLASFRSAMNDKTKLVVCTHASNVFGVRFPVEGIAALAHRRGAKICVDAAQSAGILPINIKESGIDYLCVAGHKGLYGPMGIGLLILRQGDFIDTLVEGGTGIQSRMPYQPEDPPERYESGTQNIPGIVGLHAGIEFVRKIGTERIYKREMKLVTYVNRVLSGMPQVETYIDNYSAPYYVPVLSFNIKGMLCEDVGDYLARKDIAVRCGYHCAPTAHDKMGSKNGTVRVAPSYFTKKSEMDYFLNSIRQYVGKNS